MKTELEQRIAEIDVDLEKVMAAARVERSREVRRLAGGFRAWIASFFTVSRTASQS